MRVALDANVVISALLFPSKLMDEVFRISSAPGNRLVLSNYVVDETVEVIGRKCDDDDDNPLDKKAKSFQSGPVSPAS